MTDFFYKPCCECNLEYTVAWFFFILSNGFALSIVWANPFDWDYGPNKSVIQFIFSCAILFLNSIFTRCICKSNRKYVSFDSLGDTNILKYGSV
tara:strand:- start:3359 stop:3640 length:282 start_codon:yes stop_codon:yes gene_type:complete